MTQVDPTTLACPSCGNTITAPLDGGRRLCINCRHEWNPNEVPALRVVPPAPQPAPTPASAVGEARPPAPPPPGPPHAAHELVELADELGMVTAGQAALEALVGTEVVLEGGQLATLVGFPDDDHAEVVIGAGTDTERLELVALGDVERSITAPPPVADVPESTAVALAAVNMTVAGLVLKAGLASIAGEYPNAELLTPPTGWLPLDVDGLPALEQGCAYAIAFLVHAYSIDREQVEAIADTLLNASQETNTMKGGTESDTDTADTEHGSGTELADTNAGDGAELATDDVHRGGD